MRAISAAAVLLVLGWTSAACGSDASSDGDEQTSSASATPTATPDPTESTESTEPTGSADPDDPVAADRDAAAKTATDFMAAINTYGPDDLDADGTLTAYAERVDPLVTPRFRTAFERTLTLAEKSVAQAGLAQSVTLAGHGVAELGADTATVLVAGTLDKSTTDASGDTTDQEPQPFRVQVTVLRTGTTWKVDDFAPVDEAGPGLEPVDGERIEDGAADARAAAATALPYVLSYDYETLTSDRAIAVGMLSPTYAEEFGTRFDGLVAGATNAQAVVKADVIAAGVTTVADDRVDVLVFLDQTSSTNASPDPTTYRNYVTAEMVLLNGVWLVDNLTT